MLVQRGKRSTEQWFEPYRGQSYPRNLVTALTVSKQQRTGSEAADRAVQQGK